MNLTQELERLAKLHAEGALNAEEFAKAKSQFLSAQPSQTFPVKGIRRQSARTCCGLPLWAIAIGPDLSGARRALHRPAGGCGLPSWDASYERKQVLVT